MRRRHRYDRPPMAADYPFTRMESGRRLFRNHAQHLHPDERLRRRRRKHRRKLNAMPEQVKAIAARISDAGAAPLPLLVRGAWPRIKSSVIRPLFERFAMSPAPFHVNGGCTGCGLCARSCPMNNISMLSTDNDATARPHWGKNCALCLRCYHICPRRAVAYGRHATDGKGQWINPVLMKKTT